ncbi:hypothetical protein K456DRAFT_1412081 [Colletotrichum gloeosporioides 23]|nr:hypothetical protein K456DRAFT_1412081 [Colletotrichum gloeosporioides 23]
MMMLMLSLHSCPSKDRRRRGVTCSRRRVRLGRWERGIVGGVNSIGGLGLVSVMGNLGRCRADLTLWKVEVCCCSYVLVKKEWNLLIKTWMEIVTKQKLHQYRSYLWTLSNSSRSMSTAWKMNRRESRVSTWYCSHSIRARSRPITADGPAWRPRSPKTLIQDSYPVRFVSAGWPLAKRPVRRPVSQPVCRVPS